MKKYNISKNAFIDIVNLLNNNYDTSQDIKLRDTTPDILVKCGIKNYPMLMNSSHILDNILTEDEVKELGIYKKRTNYHGLGVKQFLEIINEIDNPIAIYRWNYNKDKKYGKKDYVILLEIEKYGESIITIYVETQGNYNSIRMNANKIKTVFSGNNLKSLYKKREKSYLVTKIYEKKTNVATTLNTAVTGNSFNEINISQEK